MQKEYLTYKMPDTQTAHAVLAELLQDHYTGHVSGAFLNVLANHLPDTERQAISKKVADQVADLLSRLKEVSSM